MSGAALRNLYRAILLPSFALLLLGAMWAAALYQTGQERAGARHEGVQQAHAQARTLAENVTFLLRQADHATQLFKVKYEETGGALRLAEFARANGLLATLIPPRLELPLALYGADGRLADSLHGPFAPDVASAPFFRSLATAAGGRDAAQFTTTVVDPSTKRWEIQVARRLQDDADRFAGIVVLRIDPAVFIDDYDRVRTAPGGVVLLQSVTTGLATGRVDERLFSTDTLRFRPGPLPDETVPRTPVDSVPRLYAQRAMPRYALTAIVGHTLDSTLATTQRRRDLYLGAVTATSLLVLGFMVLLARQSRQLRRSTLAANEAQRRLRAAADASLDALFLLQACRTGDGAEPDDFILTDVNERGAAMLGHPREKLLGQRIGELVPAWRTGRFLDKYRAVLATGQPLEEEFEIRTQLQMPTDEPRWLQHQIVAIDDGVAVTTRDITARKRSVAALRESEARLRTIADAMPAMIAYLDADEVYRFQNRAYERECTRLGAQAIGRPAREVLGEVRYGELLPYIRRAQAGETIHFEEQDDAGHTFDVMYLPQKAGDSGRIVGFHVVRTDITAQKAEQRRLLKLARIDPLTGLSNRAGFGQQLIEAMQSSRSLGRLMAVMYLDIDRFKAVNDTFGHAVGDALLKAFGGRLTHALRTGDTVARLGGDEFTVVMEGIGRPEDAHGAAAKIVRAMAAPFELDGVQVRVSTSIGIAYYPDGERTPEQLLHRADEFLYEAKQAGRNTFRADPAFATQPAASELA
jgi:diguanylate cyclase (GGDEF)-like protein/PAS domain S-box-containing protein